MRHRNEAETRADLIDPKLRATGWETEPQVVRREIRLVDGRIHPEGGRNEAKVADYLLCLRRGFTIAVIEAKEEGLPAGEGLGQALDYAERIGARFAYATNGHEIIERDMRSGVQRDIAEWPTPAQLWERMKGEDGLSDEQSIALLTPEFASSRTLRYYQERAVNTVLRSIAQGRLRMLLIMATGTGKTEVAFQICWRLWQSRWNIAGEHRRPRILYLADRNILVDDPKDKTFSPFGAALCKIEDGKAPMGREMHFALYQSLVGDGTSTPLFEKYPRNYFDLVIVDECHRGSASNNGLWRKVLDYFHPAAQLGLTATPVSEDDRDSEVYFGGPVYTYSLKQGIEDGFLAPYRVHRFVTSWDATGWRPTQAELDLYGRRIPDRLYNTPDFDRVLVLVARTYAMARSLTNFLDAMGPSAKTIVFCADQESAADFRDTLAELNAKRLAAHPDWVCRVTSNEGDIGRGHLSHFQDPERESPVVLTTSQLLTTGVDAPNCRNIVLMRTVTSMIEFKQMIGRGTRLCEDYGKRYFNILDYTGSATTLFADPDFDDEPFDVTESSYGQDGHPMNPDPYSPHVRSRSIAAPPPQAGAGGPDDSLAPGGAPSGKFYVAGGSGGIVSQDSYDLTDDGGLAERVPIHVSIADWVTRQFQDDAALRRAWLGSERRKEIIDALKRKGLHLAAVQQEVPLPAELDPLDVLASLAFAVEPKSRAQRAARVRTDEQAFLDGYQTEARGVLEVILDRYIGHGPEEFTLPDVLEGPPLCDRMTVEEYVDLFGGVDALRDAVTGLQRLVYELPLRDGG